jgi:amino acid adenylation domain-containing protein
MLLQQFLERSASRLSQKTALVADGRRLTYAELDRQCNAWARALRAQGVERGDRVVIYLDNGAHAVMAIFAALKAGAVFSVLNPTSKTERLAYILNDCGAKALVSHVEKLDRVRDAVAAAATVRLVGLAGPRGAVALDGDRSVLWLDDVPAEGAGSRPVAAECIDVDLAALVYTSGSTADPKGVMLTHLNMVAAATSITTYLENVEDDIILNVLPLSFDYGMYQVLMAFKFGGTVIVEKSFAYPHAVLTRIAEERVTGFPIVPTVTAILLQLDLRKYDLSSLRYVTNTGAALPTDHILKLRRLLPHARIFSMYGLTECKRVAYLPPEELDARPTSVGKAMPNVEVYLVDEDGRRMPPGSAGELVIRGSNVMKGYWGLPEATDRVLRPGAIPGEKVLHSGDLFRTDHEGYLYFVGRRDEVLKSRGEKVSPREVENVLYGLEGVAEAAVVGVPDAILGQAVKAFVVPKSGARLTAQVVLAHCKAHLEDFKVPKLVEFREGFPRTSSGKIDKKAL